MTGNTHVTLRNSTVLANRPDFCNPENTILGCVN